MKCHKTLFFFLAIVLFNIFHVVYGVPSISGNKSKMELKGEFDDSDPNATYYLAMYVKLEKTQDSNYLVWFTFTTAEKIKNGFGSEQDKTDAILPHDWTHNTEDPEGNTNYQDGHVKVCKMKETFKKDEYKGKYSDETLNRTFKDFSEILKDYNDEATTTCFDIPFRYAVQS